MKLTVVQFGYGIIYSKHIDSKIKRFIDSMMSSKVEFITLLKKEKIQTLIEEEDPLKPVSSYFKKVINIYDNAIILIFSLIIEILLFLYKFKKICSI